MGRAGGPTSPGAARESGPLSEPRAPRGTSPRPSPWLFAITCPRRRVFSPLAAFPLGPRTCALKAGSAPHTKSTRPGCGVHGRGRGAESTAAVRSAPSPAQGCGGA